MKSVLISGVSSGLGKALAEKYLEQGAVVYGFSRRECSLNNERFHFKQIDLEDAANLPGALYELLVDVDTLDLAVLNAGILGRISKMGDAPLAELKKCMDINLWANKILLDWLFKHMALVSQVVAISSGASVNGNKGWGGYALSKAALNMLVQLYASEFPETHFTALAPGLVDTAMQDYLCSLSSGDEFPSINRIQESRGTEKMPTAQQLSEKLAKVFDGLLLGTSGSFVDVRSIG